MPKEICHRLDNIEREIQLLLLMQTATSRMPTQHSCDSSDSDVIYCTPANCADVRQPDATKSGHELASSNDECPCPPPVDDQRHDFLKENVFVSVKTAKKQSRAAAPNRKKTTVSCDIRRGGRYEQPERPCRDNCQGVCNPDEPQRDESCHAQCDADCSKMAAERDKAGGSDRGSKVLALEEQCRLLAQQNGELHALLDSNRAQVRESVQSKELALAMARQLKEKNDTLRAEKELLERCAQPAQPAQPAQTGQPEKETGEPTPSTTPTSEPTQATPEATSDDADGKAAAVRQDDVGAFEGVVAQDASQAVDAVPSDAPTVAEERARLADVRVRDLEEQVRDAQARAHAAEERARLAERRLDDMDKTCECQPEGGAVEGGAAEVERREEPTVFFDAEEQPKTSGKEIDESATQPASVELDGTRSQSQNATSQDLDARESSKSTSKEMQSSSQAEELKTFKVVLEEAVIQSERLKSLSQELVVAKSDSQKLKFVTTVLIQLESYSQELEQEIAELKEENQQMFREASDTAQECCSCAEEVVRLRSTVEDLGGVMSVQQERIGELQEINGMQEKLVRVQQQQMDAKEDQVRRASQEVEVVRRKSNDLDEQVKRLRTSIESFERVQMAGEARDDQEMQQARSRIAELTAEVDGLRKTVDEYKRQLDDCKSTRSQSGPVVEASMSDESCHCEEQHHCPCLDGDDGERVGVARPCSVNADVVAGEDADAEFHKFQRDAQQAKQEVELIRKRSSELGDAALERSVRSIERLQTELQQEQRRSAEKIEAVTSHYRESLEKEQDKVLIKDKIVEDQAATILQLKEHQKRLERDLKDSNQRAAQLLMKLKEAQRREKELSERLRSEEADEAEEGGCACVPACHEQLDAQDAALQQLEVQVAVKQREWECKMRALHKEKEAAVAAARFATVKLVEATNEFRRQLGQHKEVQHMLASAMAQRQAQQAQRQAQRQAQQAQRQAQRQAQQAQQAQRQAQRQAQQAQLNGRKTSGCICSGDDDLPLPPQESALSAGLSWTARRQIVIQSLPSRSKYIQ